jgi:hypothetical protein
MNRIRLATAGLFVAWMAHDLEELATMSHTSRTLARRLPDSMPLPASMRQHGLTTRHLTTAIPAVGLVVAAASICGYRTKGRSAFYQNTLLGFGLHGLGHIGVSLLTGRLHQRCRHLSDRCRRILAVGNPDPPASRRSQPTQPSGRDRPGRRIPRRRPSRPWGARSRSWP